MTGSQFLSLFDNVKASTTKGQFYADCPICDRQKHGRHASILFKDTKILVNCWKCKEQGRRAADIIAPLGLQVSDLFTDEASSSPIIPQKTHTPTPQRAAEPPVEHGEIIEKRKHFYKSQNGDIIGAKSIQKYADGHKACYWYRYENGRYLQGLNGINMPIYNADKVAQADIVVIAEGEKDADTLCALGYCGTTLPYGGNQSRWTEQLSESFRDKRIFILTDNDATGNKYAATLISGLMISNTDFITIIPIKSLWMDAPKKADISDFVKAKGREKAILMLKYTIGEAEERWQK